MIQFRISPVKSAHYFNVIVFDGKRDMYKFFKEFAPLVFGEEATTVVPKFEAITLTYEWLQEGKDGVDVRKKDIGTIMFYDKSLNTATVSHELIHAAMWFDRLINNNACALYGLKCGDAEERLAHTHTELLKSFLRKVDRADG